MISIASFIIGVAIILIWIFVNTLNIRKLDKSIKAIKTKMHNDETITNDKIAFIEHNIKEIRLTDLPQVKYELDDLAKKVEKPVKKSTPKKTSKPKETIKSKIKKES